MLARVPSRSREKTSAVQSLWGALEQGGPRDPGFLVGGDTFPGSSWRSRLPASSPHREGAGGDVDVVQAQADDVGARQRVHRGQQHHRPVVVAVEAGQQPGPGGLVEAELKTSQPPDEAKRF
jgi:hypothetical protein